MRQAKYVPWKLSSILFFYLFSLYIPFHCTISFLLLLARYSIMHNCLWTYKCQVTRSFFHVFFVMSDTIQLIWKWLFLWLWAFITTTSTVFEFFITSDKREWFKKKRQTHMRLLFFYYHFRKMKNHERQTWWEQNKKKQFNTIDWILCKCSD